MIVEVSVELLPITCAQCGCVFGLSRTMYDNLRAVGGGFFCVNGHSLTYGETEVQRLRKEKARLTSTLDQERAQRHEERERAKRAEATLKGHVTRLKNQAATGQCPCCDKAFPDLEAHMKESHPGFEQSEE